MKLQTTFLAVITMPAPKEVQFPWTEKFVKMLEKIKDNKAKLFLCGRS
jgi:hypothetical protein